MSMCQFKAYTPTMKLNNNPQNLYGNILTPIASEYDCTGK